jgi:uncharacterized protein
MHSDLRSPTPGPHRVGRWRVVGLVVLGLGALTIATLEVWAYPPSSLGGPRDLVVEELHWLRVHLLTSGPLGVVLTAVLGFLEFRRRRRSARAARVALLAAHCWVDPATKGLPKVSAVRDPVQLGVHPAAALGDLDPASEAGSEASGLGLPERVPVYVPRDLDARLDAALARALARGGLVLLRGDSTAGKSRAAYEAMRRLPGDLRLLVPHRPDSLRALLDGGIELREVVVWLNELDHWLGTDGLDVGLLRRLLGGDRRVVVLATMRSSEYAKRSPERARSEAERDLLRSQRELLDQAVDFELPRRFSDAERERAAERTWDPRIADALAHAGQYGLAEYVAAGPRLWRRWRNARAVDNPDHEQAGAAIVAAAVDCRRAGLRRPASTQLLRQLFRDPAYLDPLVARRLDSAAFDQGLAWARKPVQGTAALLVADAGGEAVFDYLLDAVEANPKAAAVPATVWECLLADLDPKDGVGVGVAAYLADKYGFAERAWRLAVADGDDDAAYPLGVLFKERGDVEEAEVWWRRAAVAGDHYAMISLGALIADRGDHDEAEEWLRRAADAGHRGAENNLGLLFKERGDLKKAERWYRRAATAGFHLAEANLGLLLKERGDLEEAEEWLRRAATAGDHDAETDLGLLLVERGDLEEAEQWLRRAATAGNHRAETSLGPLLAEQGAFKEAEVLLQRAADAGDHNAEHNLGVMFLLREELKEAEEWLRRAATACNHRAELLLGVLLRDRGDPQHEAEKWLRRAAQADDHYAAYNLGLLFEERGDLNEAERWLHRAAEGDHYRAQAKLGVLLRDRGDLKEAQEWLRRAADAGDDHARRELKQLRDRRKNAKPDGDRG